MTSNPVYLTHDMTISRVFLFINMLMLLMRVSDVIKLNSKLYRLLDENLTHFNQENLETPKNNAFYDVPVLVYSARV